MLYPLTFDPIFKERVWGGRNLESLYGKPLPPDVPIGESWEITDRPEGVSVIAHGPLKGKDLRWLMQSHANELLGPEHASSPRFPLLVKILDARQRLSVQVHPPSGIAPELGGEPKSEMWHITHADPDADIYVGLRNGVSRETFERGMSDGSVEDCLHRIETGAGDSIYLPSGRLHAIGGGNVIFEIQQNSDTTYRVFDWNRVGLDGKPRQLHVDQALRSIDFADFEPPLSAEPWIKGDGLESRLLTSNEHFEVVRLKLSSDEVLEWKVDGPWIIAAVDKTIEILGENAPPALRPGQFAVIPACQESLKLRGEEDAALLRVRLGVGHPKA